jgi:hypothetical protein
MEERRESDHRIDILTERVENWMESTTEYRKSLCSKIEQINQRLNMLPCREAEQVSKGIRSDISWLQRGAIAIISCLFLGGVWVGTIGNTVRTNTDKWKILEPEHQDLIKDVEVLKEKSYGYRGVKVVTDGNEYGKKVL